VTTEMTNRLGVLIVGVVGLALLLGLPELVDEYSLLQLTVYAVMGILGLSLGFIWGFGGILCFGQSAFFGLGGYAYAIAVINIGDSTLPILMSIILPAALAAALGYFMFYSRISDVYVGVITLTVALIFFNVVNSTSGSQYHIGAALLGGFNGIPAIPPLNYPFLPDDILSPSEMFRLSLGLLLLVYFGLRAVLATRFGRVVVAIRENEQRVEFIGYDVRLHKLVTFTIGGAIAGLAGCLFANWGSFVSPTLFGIIQSAQIIIWVMVGGLGTLLGPILGAAFMSWLAAVLGSQNAVNTPLMFGAILIVFVLLVPNGILPTVGQLLAPLFPRAARRAAAAPAHESKP
jgi:ABC-type branched-subunit amino acid transport system permease subunit